MSATRLITVYGATGAQGQSVVQALLRDKSGTLKVRAITRNPESDASKALAKAGVEVIKADGLQASTLESAFSGSWGVFVNTNSDDPAVGQPDGPSETDIGKDIVNAASKAGVKHFVYSGLASASKITNGEIPSECFDEKDAIAEYARSAGTFNSVAVISPGWYMENFLSKDIASLFGGLPYFPDEEGYLTLHWPRWGGNNEVPFTAIGADFGDYVHGIFLQPDKYNGKFIQALSESRSLENVAVDLEKVTSKKARFVPIEDWRSMDTFGERFMITVKLMFGFCQHSGGLYYGEPNDSTLAKELKRAAVAAQGGDSDGELLTLEGFFKQHFGN